ncbi:hypothetical protein OQA88_12129 [Cercophora sp. LCS_1]
MADTREGSRSKGAIRPRLGGILGRLTYAPSEGSEPIGDLQLNRAKNETPYFQQVTPFKQWCAATRSAAYKFDGQPPWRIARSQRNWLLKTYPDALLTDEDTEMLHMEEIADAGHSSPHTPAPESATLLATGQIIDLRNRHDAAVGVPALALASGHSGQTLRLMCFAKEERIWDSEDLKVSLDTLNPRLTGEWTQDSLPITLIKFALDGAKYDPIRWLIVQRASSTTICEPELRIISTKYTELSGKDSFSSQIIANPLFTINSGQTGGVAHSDAAFNPVFGQDPPQLVIIDQIGTWSVWDIHGRRAARQKTLKPVMRWCGNIAKGILSKMLSPGAQIRQQHTILWLTLDRTTLKTWSGPREPTPESETSRDAERPRLLLMASTNAVSLVDTENTRWLSVTSAILTHPTQRVLDVKPSPLSPYQAFILTSTMIIWVTARETGSGKLSLEVLASCAHRRDGLTATLRLDISPAAKLSGRKACFASVRSVKNSQMTIVWFINPQPGYPAQYYHSLVTLEGLSNCVGLDMLPVVRLAEDDAGVRGNGILSRKTVRFFQILALGEDLNLRAALCVWLDQPDVKVPPPETLVERKRIKAFERSERKKFLRLLGEKFVVPDGYDERQTTRLIRPAQEMPETPREGLVTPLKTGYYKAFSSRVSKDRQSLRDPSRAWTEPEGVSLSSIGYTIQQRKIDGLMRRYSLLELAGPGRTLEELMRLAAEWESRRIDLEEEEGLAIMAPGEKMSGLNLDDTISRFENLFDGPQLYDGELALLHRHRCLQHLAAETVLSEVGIVAQEEDEPARPVKAESEELQSSMSFQSSPPLPLSQEEPELPSLRPTAQVEDPVSIRTRRLAFMKPVMTNTRAKARTKTGKETEEETAVHSHWELGADPNMVNWNPCKSRDDEVDDRLRKKMERARKRAEKLASQGVLDGVSKVESQPLPVIVASQQELLSVPGPSSQVWGAPSQSLSQIVPGAFGGRPKKKKVKSGFR